MNRRQALLAAVPFALGVSRANPAPVPPLRFPFRADGKWGYIDASGRTVIEPRYDLTGEFSQGLAFVLQGRDCLAIDLAGAVAFRSPFTDYPGSFSNGLARGYDDRGAGFVDRKGHVLPRRFKGAGDFSAERAAVRLAPDRPEAGRFGPWGYIDTTGELVVPAIFTAATRFSEGLAAVYVGGQKRECTGVSGGHWGYIDRTGKLVIPATLQWCQPFSDGVAWFTVPPDERGDGYGMGLIDTAGRVVLEPRPYFTASDFREGLASVRGVPAGTSGSIQFLGVIDKAGRVVIPSPLAPTVIRSDGRDVEVVMPERLAAVGPFSGGLAAAYLPSTWDERKNIWTDGLQGYIDRRGKWAIEPQFTHAGDFRDGLARVQSLDGGFGYIGRDGRRIVWSAKR